MFRYLIFILFITLSCNKGKFNDSLNIDGKRFIIKGINYNPVEKCKYLDSKSLENSLKKDLPILKELGVNTIRIYPVNYSASLEDPNLMPISVLDELHKNGIKVIINFLMHHFANPEKAQWEIRRPLVAYKDHPAILFYMIGNEINLNRFYTKKEIQADDNKFHLTTLESIKYAKTLIKYAKNLTKKKIAVSYGIFKSPEKELLLLTGEKDENNDPADDADIISYQIYNPKDLEDAINKHHKYSKKPFLISEYGVDAFNGNTKKIDESTQERYNFKLTKLILDNAKKNNGLGGILFEYVDEYWKYRKGDLCKQETVSIPFKDNNYPDNMMHEEFWGIVDMDRKPRKTFSTLKELYRNY